MTYHGMMQRDRITAAPSTAQTILILGALVHFLACRPLYGRRGYPEVDPFWLAMVWLWVPAVFISAAFVPFNRCRIRDLLLYSFPTAFAVSWSTLGAVPSYKTAIQAFQELIAYWPVTSAGICIVEAGSRVFWIGVRRFVKVDLVCDKCGYCLFGLTQPRCPECGTAFDLRLLEPIPKIAVTRPYLRFTVYLPMIALILAGAYPFYYQHRSYRRCYEFGQTRARAEWQVGTAVWYVSSTEYERMANNDPDRASGIDFGIDVKTGLRMKRIWPNWDDVWYARGYRSVIEEQLRNAGKPFPTSGPGG